MTKEDEELLIKEIANYNGNIPLIIDTTYKKSIMSILKDKKINTKIIINNELVILVTLLNKYKNKLNDNIKMEMYLRDINLNNNLFEYVPEELKNNELFTLVAISINPKSINYIGEKLNNKQFILKSLKTNIDVYLYLTPKQKNDKDIYLTAIEKLESNPFRIIDYEVKLEDVYEDYKIFSYLSDESYIEYENKIEKNTQIDDIPF